MVRELKFKAKEMCQQGKRLNGRQLYWMVKNTLIIGKWDKSMKSMTYLYQLHMTNQNLSTFHHDFEEILLSVAEKPDPKQLETLYSRASSDHAGFRPTFEVYQMQCTWDAEYHNFDTLKKLVAKHIADEHEKTRLNEYHGTNGFGAGMPSMRSGECSQAFYKGQCANRRCPLTHDQKGQGMKGRGRGRGQSRGRGKGKGK